MAKSQVPLAKLFQPYTQPSFPGPSQNLLPGHQYAEHESPKWFIAISMLKPITQGLEILK